MKENTNVIRVFFFFLLLYLFDARTNSYNNDDDDEMKTSECRVFDGKVNKKSLFTFSFSVAKKSFHISSIRKMFIFRMSFVSLNKHATSNDLFVQHTVFNCSMNRYLLSERRRKKTVYLTNIHRQLVR